MEHFQIALKVAERLGDEIRAAHTRKNIAEHLSMVQRRLPARDYAVAALASLQNLQDSVPAQLQIYKLLARLDNPVMDQDEGPSPEI
ncbi:MAG: hypothetical protein HY820_28865 [Acidobacteria bacterium]|nr:hypothetical protein [Acidobacteriota bacterium]